MNKLENNKINEGALTKQIKTLVMQERYEEAMKVLDEIEVSKIRNISILCLVGEAARKARIDLRSVPGASDPAVCRGICVL